MALTGILAGFNEQQRTEADLDLRRAQTMEAQAQARARIADEFEKKETKTILSSIAQGEDPTSFYRTAAQRLQGINPKTAMEYARAADEMDLRKSQLEEQSIKRKQTEEGRQASILGSISSPETYRQAMMGLVSSGASVPQWYTGNYERDKPFITQAVNASLSRKEQLGMEHQQRSEDLAERQFQQRIKEHEISAKHAEAQLALQTQNARDLDRYRQESLAQSDSISAQKREGKEKYRSISPTANELRLANNLVESRDEFKELPYAQKEALAADIASTAKRSMVKEDDPDSDFGDYLDDALHKAKGRITPDTRKFFGLIGDAPKYKHETTEPEKEVPKETQSPKRRLTGEDWINAAMKQNAGLSREQIIEIGRQRGVLK